MAGHRDEAAIGSVVAPASRSVCQRTRSTERLGGRSVTAAATASVRSASSFAVSRLPAAFHSALPGGCAEWRSGMGNGLRSDIGRNASSAGHPVTSFLAVAGQAFPSGWEKPHRKTSRTTKQCRSRIPFRGQRSGSLREPRFCGIDRTGVLPLGRCRPRLRP